MADNSTKIIVGIVMILAIMGVVFLLKEGGSYKIASQESPGQYGWTGECCTCTRAQTTLRGAVLPQTTEVLFRNVQVPDCAAACTQAHLKTKIAGIKYALMPIISNDAECRTSLPVPLGYGGSGGFNDQRMLDQYYVAS